MERERVRAEVLRKRDELAPETPCRVQSADCRCCRTVDTA